MFSTPGFRQHRQAALGDKRPRLPHRHAASSMLDMIRKHRRDPELFGNILGADPAIDFLLIPIEGALLISHQHAGQETAVQGFLHAGKKVLVRSEEHTSELQYLMRISYA